MSLADRGLGDKNNRYLFKSSAEARKELPPDQVCQRERSDYYIYTLHNIIHTVELTDSLPVGSYCTMVTSARWRPALPTEFRAP